VIRRRLDCLNPSPQRCNFTSVGKYLLVTAAGAEVAGGAVDGAAVDVGVVAGPARG